MTCVRIPNGIMCLSSGTDHSIIDHTGKIWWFEFDARFGPLVLTPSSKVVSEWQPDEHSRWKPFWKAFNVWNVKHVAKDKP